MEIDSIAPGKRLEDMRLMGVRLPLYADHQEPRPVRVTRRVVNLAVIHQEIGRCDLNEAIHHLLQFRRVSAEGHGRVEHRAVALNDRFGDLPAGVIFNAHARRFYPAAKATQTMGQFHFAQAEDLDFRAAPPEHVQQRLKSRGKIPVRKSTAIENYDLFAGHAVPPCADVTTRQSWRPGLSIPGAGPNPLLSMTLGVEMHPAYAGQQQVRETQS